MAMTEEQRHELYTRLEEVIGMGAATTLMEGMPPVGWADIATKRDLDHLEERLGSRIDRVDARIDHLEERLGSRIDRVDARIDHLEERLGSRIDRVDARIDHLEERLEGFERTVTAEFHAALERSLREQSNRFLLGTGVILTLLLTAQEILGRV